MITFFIFLVGFSIVFYLLYSYHVSVPRVPLTHRKSSYKEVLLNNKDLVPLVVLIIVISLIIIVIATTGVGATESNIYYYGGLA